MLVINYIGIYSGFKPFMNNLYHSIKQNVKENDTNLWDDAGTEIQQLQMF